MSRGEDWKRMYKALTSTVTDVQREHVRLKKSLSSIKEDQDQLRELIGQVKQLQEELRETMFSIHQDHTQAANGVLELQRYCIQVDKRLSKLEHNQTAIKASVAALTEPGLEQEQDPDQPKWKFWA